MDSFDVVNLAGDALDEARRRVQEVITGHRGRANDPLYRSRKTLRTGVDLLAVKQQERNASLFANPNSTEVEITWSVYKDIVSSDRTADRNEGKKFLRPAATTRQRICRQS